MRFTISANPCSAGSVAPTGMVNFTGQRISPPALLDISPVMNESQNVAYDIHAIRIAAGIKTRPCREDRSTRRYAAPSITMPANIYHYSSSHAFELRLNA